MILRLIGVLLASYGFGHIYNIKGKKLIFGAVGGFLGALVYEVCLLMGIKELMALLFSSMSISIYAEIMARRLKTPVTGFILIALIILVPGGGMYYTMLYTANAEVSKAIFTGIDTLAKAGVLALGAILISSIKKLLFNDKV